MSDRIIRPDKVNEAVRWLARGYGPLPKDYYVDEGRSPHSAAEHRPLVHIRTVIELRFNRGSGTTDDPVRSVMRLLDHEDGSLIVEVDPRAGRRTRWGDVKE
ncbi:MAG TPA: hypothetical protein VFH61_00705 [Thermoleophilia bacterium]|nr:hypothetical protein [Thermoleophilia bacterium]